MKSALGDIVAKAHKSFESAGLKGGNASEALKKSKDSLQFPTLSEETLLSDLQAIVTASDNDQVKNIFKQAIDDCLKNLLESIQAENVQGEASIKLIKSPEEMNKALDALGDFEKTITEYKSFLKKYRPDDQKSFAEVSAIEAKILPSSAAPPPTQEAPTVRDILRKAHQDYHKAREDNGVYRDPWYRRIFGESEKIKALKRSKASIDDLNVKDEDLLADVRAIIAADQSKSSRSYQEFSKALREGSEELAGSLTDSLVTTINNTLTEYNAHLKALEEKTLTTYKEYLTCDTEFNNTKNVATQNYEGLQAQTQQLQKTLNQYIQETGSGQIGDKRRELAEIELALRDDRAIFLREQKQHLPVNKEVLESAYNALIKGNFLEKETKDYETLQDFQTKAAALEKNIATYKSLVERMPEEQKEARNTARRTIETLEKTLKETGEHATSLHHAFSKLSNHLGSITQKISDVQKTHSAPDVAGGNTFLRQIPPLAKFESGAEVKLTQEYLDKIATELNSENFQKFLKVAIEAGVAYRDMKVIAQDPDNQKFATSVDYTTVMPVSAQIITTLPLLLKDVADVADRGKALGLDVSAVAAVGTKLQKDINDKINEVNEQKENIASVKLPDDPRFSEVKEHLTRIAIYQRAVGREIGSGHVVAANQLLTKLQKEIVLSVNSVTALKKTIATDTSLSSEQRTALGDKANEIHYNLTTVLVKQTVPELNQGILDTDTLDPDSEGERYQELLKMHCRVQVLLRSLDSQPTLESKQKTLQEAKLSYSQFQTIMNIPDSKQRLSVEQKQDIKGRLKGSESQLENAELQLKKEAQQADTKSQNKAAVSAMTKGFSAVISKSRPVVAEPQAEAKSSIDIKPK